VNKGIKKTTQVEQFKGENIMRGSLPGDEEDDHAVNEPHVPSRAHKL
jgi:hypothetical protein